jgi:phenylacetate-CoA ligase
VEKLATRASQLSVGPFWDENRETMPTEQRMAVILERVQAQLKFAYDTLPFYRSLYDAHGFHPRDVRTLDDFPSRVPIITKQMLRDDQAKHPPFGSYSCTKPEDISRIFGSSGTTGTPTIYAISREDWSYAAEAQAMALYAAGVRPEDTVHFMFPFGMFVGGWALLMACERIGATVFPVGAVESKRQLDLIDQLRPSVIAGTPSYLLHLGDVAAKAGVDLKRYGVRLFLVGGEPGGSLDGVLSAMRNAWGQGIVVSDTGNTSECFPTQMNTSCDRGQGMHIFEDEVYLEIVDPENPRSRRPDGEFGATVYTTLYRRSQPMIRFYAGDRARLTRETCSCGRTYPRLAEGLVGRYDDMLLIRGANIYPSAIDNVLRNVPGVGTEYRVIVEKKGALDELRIEAEAPAGADAAACEELRQRVLGATKRNFGIRVDVAVVPAETFERMLFKARRVVDRRPQAK